MTASGTNVDVAKKRISLPVALSNYVASPSIVSITDYATYDAKFSGEILVAMQDKSAFTVMVMRDNYAYLDNQTFYFGVIVIGSM